MLETIRLEGCCLRSDPNPGRASTGTTLATARQGLEPRDEAGVALPSWGGTMGNRISVFMAGLAFLFAFGGAVRAEAMIVQVFDPTSLTGGPFTVEDFEDDIFEPGIIYSASSGVRRRRADGTVGGVTPSGLWGLSTNNFPDPISLTLNLGTPATSVGMWFGNDDTCCSAGFVANLDIFDSGGLIGTISLTANMNDFADQFLGFNSDELVTNVSLRYGSGSDVGLYHYIDDVYFNAVPEPSTGLLLGLGLTGLAMGRRRRAPLRKSGG